MRPLSSTALFRFSAFSFSIAVLILSASTAAAIQTPPTPEVDLAASLFVKNCISCHAGATIGSDMHLQNTAVRTTASLKSAVNRMQRYTAVMTEEEIDSLVELLHDPLLMDRLADAEEFEAQAEDAVPPAQESAPASSLGNDNPTALAKPNSNWMLSPESAAAETPTSATETAADAAGDIDIAAEFFNKSCAACHAMDGAKRTGPNLAGTVTWPEAELDAAVRRMEKYAGPMEDVQVKSLVELLHDANADERLQAAVATEKKKQVTSMEKPSIATGEQLFHGGLPFTNGGVSCVSCHAVSQSGGSMGPDLTHVFTKLGEMGLRSASEQGNFKVMSAAYRDHKVTPQEAAHLTAYLENVDKAPPPARGSAVPLIGTAGAAAFLGLLGFIFQKHKGDANHYKLQRRR